jgi:TolB-like protein/Tfp pilus assembly protein PilF
MGTRNDYEKESNDQARQLLLKAIELDPKYARAMAFLGFTHIWDARFGWVKDRHQSIKKAEELAKRALAVDETVYLGHILLGNIYERRRLYKQAIAAKERGIESEPNNAIAIGSLGMTMLYAGKPEEGLVLFKKMNRLSPYPYGAFLAFEGLANYLIGRYEESITLQKKFLGRQKHGAFVRISRALLIASYMELGRVEEAQAEAAKWLEQHPDISIEAYIKAMKSLPLKDRGFLDRQNALLRKAGLPETPPIPLPDKPSIAVLPFVNMSGDPEQEYFSDGISEEIITALSKTPKIFVIARTSSFKYKGKEVDVRTVGRELGVRYVMEGSVRKSEDKLRITAQLVDAKTGNHLWAERYDRELKDIFAVQDEITKKIITALQVELTDGELARFAAKGTENLQAYLKFMQGREPFYTITKEGNVQARSMFEEAIALDPEYAAAYIYVGATHYLDVVLGSSKSRKESLEQAFKYITKGKALDESHPWGHHQLGWLYSYMKRQYDRGIVECERAITLAPNSANSHFWMSLVLMLAGRHEESVQYAEQTLRLDPFPTHLYFRRMGSAYSWVGRYEEAIAFYKKAIQGAPNDILTHRGLTRTYIWAGLLEEARAQAEEVLKINPRFCIRGGSGPYKNPADMELVRNALRKAGLPDCPPRQGSK